MFFSRLVKKAISQMTPTKLAVFAFLALLLGSYLYHVSVVSGLEADLRDARNSLSEAIGSIEIAEGVQGRLGVEVRNLNNRVDDLLGENTRLEGLIGTRETQIRELVQANATLAESLDFSSNNPESNATVTVITDCDETSQDETVTVDAGVGDEVQNVPNIRTDFSLTRLGFRIDGFTTTNPALAELSLTQTEPFIIDVAVIEDTNGTRSVMLSEQQDRLRLNIGAFSYATRPDRIRWYELFSVGGTLAYTGDRFMMGPTLNIETRRRLVMSGGPIFSPAGGVGGHMTFTVRPFIRNRR